MLPQHGEDELAARVLTITDAELERIGELGARYAWSVEAFELGLGMGGTRALCLATIDVLEGNMRELRQTRTQRELNAGMGPELSDVEIAGERSLRLRATKPTGGPFLRRLSWMCHACRLDRGAAAR